MDLEDELKQLVATLSRKGQYYYETKRFPFKDFNRQLIEPGTKDSHPEGALAIYTDDDFWCLAGLPYKFKDLPLKKVVAILWPDRADTAIYKPDHGDTAAWEAYDAECRRRIEQLGPNEPFVDFSWPIEND